MNFSAMITETQRLLGKDTKFDTTTVGARLNISQVDIAILTKLLEGNVDMNCTANTAEYAYPAGSNILKLLHVLFYNGSYYDKLSHMAFNTFLKTSGDVFGTPEAWYDRPAAQKFGLFPIPGSAGTNYIRLYFIPNPTTMAVTSQETCDLPAYTHQAICIHAGMWLSMPDKDETEIGRWQALLDRELAKIRHFNIPKAAVYQQEDSDAADIE